MRLTSAPCSCDISSLTFMSIHTPKGYQAGSYVQESLLDSSGLLIAPYAQSYILKSQRL